MHKKVEKKFPFSRLFILKLLDTRRSEKNGLDKSISIRAQGNISMYLFARQNNPNACKVIQIIS